MNERCVTDACDLWDIRSHVMNETWLIHLWDMTHSSMDMCYSFAWHHACDLWDIRSHVSCLTDQLLDHMSHVSQINETCDLMSHRSMRDVMRMNRTCPWMNESCLTDEWVMSHRWMSHVSQMNKSCLTDECVMARRWTSDLMQMNRTCH